MAIKLKDPYGRKTDANVKKFIDALMKETKPPKELVKVCAVLIFLIEFAEHSKTMDRKTRQDMQKLIKKFESEIERSAKKVKELTALMKQQGASSMLAFQKTIAFPDRANFLAASVMSLKQAGPEGERSYTELTNNLHKMYKEVDALFFKASGKHLFEGLGSALKSGSMAVLNTLWTVIKKIFGPILKIGLMIVKAIWKFVEPIISFFEMVFEKSRISKLPEILGPVGVALSWLGVTAVSGVACQVGAGVFIAQKVFDAKTFASMGSEMSDLMGEADMMDFEGEEGEE